MRTGGRNATLHVAACSRRERNILPLALRRKLQIYRHILSTRLIRLLLTAWRRR